MPKASLHMQSSDEVEIVFYEAFMHGDPDVMAALWADSDVICVHPGSGVIKGYEAVTRSWRHILENTEGSDIRYSLLRKSLADELAVHNVVEEILNEGTLMAVVVATNVYQKFEQGWLMVEHHASIVQQENTGQTLQ